MIFTYIGSLAMTLMTFMINIVQIYIPWKSQTVPIMVARVVMETGTWVYWHYWGLGTAIMAQVSSFISSLLSNKEYNIYTRTF